AVGELDLRPTALIRPDAIAGEERKVRQGFLSTRLRGALDGDPRLDVPDPRVAEGLLRARRGGQTEGQHQQQPASRHVHHPAPREKAPTSLNDVSKTCARAVDPLSQM